MKLFDKWFEEMQTGTEMYEESNGVTFVTATKTGRPSARLVLLKGKQDFGF